MELVVSILRGLYVYTCQVFILPKGVIKEIDGICCNFLWAGKGDSSTTHPVAGKYLCLPRRGRGLGIKDLSSLNKDATGENSWILLTSHNSLWAPWMRINKTRVLSFWGLVKPPDSSSAGVGSICWLSSDFRELFQYKLGVGILSPFGLIRGLMESLLQINFHWFLLQILILVRRLGSMRSGKEEDGS